MMRSVWRVKVGVTVTVATACEYTVLVGVYVESDEVVAKAVSVTVGPATVVLAKTVFVVSVVTLSGAQLPVTYVAASAVGVVLESAVILLWRMLRSL